MLRRFLQRLQVLGWLALVAGCGGGGGGESSSSCSPAPAISSTPVTTAAVGVQYAYWVESRIVCIPFFTCGGIDLAQGPPGAGVDPIRQLVYWTPTPRDARAQVPFSIVTNADLCGNRARQSWTVSVAPISPIQSFRASSVFVLSGESVTVTGVFEGSGSILGAGAVTSGVPVSVGPINGETTVRLDVRDPAGQTWSESVTIRLLTPPVITTWKAEPNIIGVGAATTLFWWVDGPVDTVRIDPGDRLVASNSALTVNPSSTTTYVLTAANRAGSVTRSVEVVVLPPSSIDEFSATAASTTVGGAVMLTARFVGSGEILKENERGGMDHLIAIGSGESASSGSLYRNTRFTLRVSGGTTVTQDLTVAVTGLGSFESVPLSVSELQDGLLLPDGRVFTTSQASAYYFEPGTKQFSSGAQLNPFMRRYLTLLGGRVMMVSPFDIGASIAEIYNPATDSYALGNLVVPGIPVQAMTLGDGRVLVRSDADARQVGQTAGVTFCPIGGVFGPLVSRPELAGTRGVLLADGRVLFIRAGTGSQIFTPGADSFASSSATFAARGTRYARVLLADGRVFIHGGQVNISQRSEIYDPGIDLVSLGNAQDYPNLDGQAAALLANGKVLIAGGSGYATALVFDPATRAFTRTGGLQVPRSDALAVRLQDGRVLVLGGCTFTPCPAELYTP